MSWNNYEWSGVFPATLCAFHEDESIDEEGLRNYFAELSTSGINGLTCNDEFLLPTLLEAAERMELENLTQVQHLLKNRLPIG